MGASPEMPSRTAKLLKRQKGKCSLCELYFREEDVIEVDHIIPRALGGKDEYKNLQLLHRHCHDEKTRYDLIEIGKMETSKLFDRINKFMSKFDWGWLNDIPYFGGLIGQKSSSDKETHFE